MSDAVGFKPVAGENAAVLVLGSMPGLQSLRQQKYYGHKRNCFWPIMQCLLAGSTEQSYAQNLSMLTESGIALWDVIASCQRAGSLDSDIDNNTIVVNDFAAFFSEHTNIRAVFFNGARAHSEYRRRVLPHVTNAFPDMHYERLLSTSPANARYTFAQKLANWSAIRGFLSLDKV